MFYFESYALNENSPLSLPVVYAMISAGEPIELESAVERVDLNELFATSSETLLLRVGGNSMEVPIFDRDWIILDRLKQPENGDIVVAKIHGGYTVKYYKTNDERGKNGLYLVPANPAYKKQEIRKKDNCEILGVVTFIIHPTS